MKLLKNCLLGISCIILSPIIVTGIVVVAIYLEHTEGDFEKQDRMIRERYLRNYGA